MGTWAAKPWDSDDAADWFASVMDKTGLAARVEATLRLDLEEYFERVRAAAAVLVLLGHVYVWPIDDLDRHLELAASKLEEILENDFYEGDEQCVRAVKAEIAVLRARLEQVASPSASPDGPWWHF